MKEAAKNAPPNAVSPTASTRQITQPKISIFDNPSNMDNSIAVAMELCEGLGVRNDGGLLRVVAVNYGFVSSVRRLTQIADIGHSHIIDVLA
jgi:hypothetical protein